MATQFEIDCALMAGGAYTENRAGVNQFPVPAGWTAISGSHFYDSATGFEAVAYKSTANPKDVVISYAGTDELVDWLANGGLSSGLGANQFRQAALYHLQVMETNSEATIAFTGHSLGGGLAALMGVMFDQRAVTFDQAPFAQSASVSVRDGVVAYLNEHGYSDARLAELVPELLSYAGNGERTGNITGLYVQGEVLQYQPFSTIGTQVSLTHGDYFAPFDLHSQALLTTFVQSDAFREMTKHLPELLGMVFDENLFAVDDIKSPDSKPNLLEHLIRHQVGLRDPVSNATTLPADAMLDRFTFDLDKLVVAQGGAGDYRDVVKALVAFAMEKYYVETDADSRLQRQLFEAVTGGLQFNTADVAADIRDAKGYGQYFSAYLETETIFSTSDRDLIRQKIADLRDWSIAVSANGMTATDTNNRGAFMLGSSGADTLTGGTAADLLAGGSGADTLTGGTGQDTLLGGFGNDILHGDDGAGGDILDGGAGLDTYHADDNDTIRDSDGKGVIYFNGKRLTFATRKKGETVWKDGNDNTYEMKDGKLLVGDPLVIEGFDNGEFGIYLDEEEDPTDPARRPAYKPDNAIARASSPLALDLDGNGVIDDIGLAGSTVYFDLTNDGVAEKSGWLAPQDGLVAMDMNGNGVIDNRDELFGTDAQHTAFDRMRELADANADGVIDAADPLFGDLRVWQDANSDGISQAWELKTLEALGITSLDAVAAPAAQATANGNRIVATAGFTMNGERRTAVDIEFTYDAALTDANPNRSLGQAPTLDAEIFDLPWLRGYGNVKSLHIACQENTELRQAATALKAQGWSGIVGNFDGFMARWTGLVQAHAAHGVTRTNLTVEDKAWMLENLTGQNVNKGAIEAANFGSISPGGGRPWNQAYVNEAWNGFVNREAMGFAIQSQDWLKGASYSLNRDRFVVMDDKRLAASLLERFNAAEGKDEAAIAAVIALRLMRDGIALDAASLKAELVDSPFKALFETVLEQGTDNRIETVAVGGDASETLQGRTGNDILMGGHGNDNLQGGIGNDTYVFGNGYGQDVIYDHDWTAGNVDTVRMTDDVRPEDVAVTRDQSHLYLSLNNGADKLTLQYWFSGDVCRIEQVAFGDGTAWDAAELTSRIVVAPATENADGLFGGEVGETVDGLGGNDTIYGYGGDDTLNGGGGNDALDGGAGNDTYLFGRGDGRDTISSYESNTAKRDAVQFKEGVSVADVQLSRQGDNLILMIAGTQDRLTILSYFWNEEGQRSYGVEAIRFEDGTTWDYATVKAKSLVATEGDDYLVGHAGGEVIDGLGGNDQLYGYGGDDTLDGGIGNDNLQGGYGNDTYLFGNGSGQDAINDYDGMAGNVDTVQMAAGIAPTDVTVTRDQYNLYLSLNGGTDRLTLQYWFYDDAYRIERVAFADGTAWDVAALKALSNVPTENADYIEGTPGDNAIDGLGGNDVIVGYGGNDILDGGSGNDTLQGGAGNDTYLFGNGSGQDVISEHDWTVGNFDTVKMAEGIRPADVTVTSDWSNLSLSINNGADKLTFQHWQYWEGYRVERIEFSDGTVWDGGYFAKAASVTAGNDVLVGTAGDERIDGQGGDDQVWGEGGDDTLVGGAGNDNVNFALTDSNPNRPLGLPPQLDSTVFDILAPVISDSRQARLDWVASSAYRGRRIGVHGEREELIWKKAA